MKKFIFALGLITFLATTNVAQAFVYQLYDASLTPTTTASSLTFSNSVTALSGTRTASSTFYFSVLSSYDNVPTQTVTIGQNYSFGGAGKWSYAYDLKDTSGESYSSALVSGNPKGTYYAETDISTNTIYGLLLAPTAAYKQGTGNSWLTADLKVTSPDNKPAATPLPAAVWLLGSGLMGLVGMRKKFKA